MCHSLHFAIEAFRHADDAWHAELVATYGKGACNARYDSKRNSATSQLAALDDARTIAQAAYDAAWQAHHAPTHARIAALAQA